MNEIKKNKMNRKQFIKGSLASLIGFAVVDAFWLERDFIDWTSFDISKNSCNKIKIIQISDLHLDDFNSVHKKIAAKINLMKPDLIMITGDTIAKTMHINSLDEFLKLIDHSIVKFAITGNWEYWGNVNLSMLRKTYLQNNCELLINQNRIVTIKERNISIIGIDDLLGGHPNFEKAVENLQFADTNVVLSHCPQYRDVIEKTMGNVKIDLVLSGHTHGGQINILGLVPFKPRGSGSYLSGWYKGENPIMYVSRGVGTSILPIRFGARAEIVELYI